MAHTFFDSTLAYYINQLDVMDPRLYEPLFNTTWGRDINLRSGITMAAESTSFMRSNIGGIGTQSATGKPWISPNTTTLPGVSIDGERVTTPIRLLGREISYSSVELERSQLLGQSIDAQKYDAMNVMYQMSTDEMVYIGDTDVGATGLLNSALVTVGSVPNGAAASPLWSNKTPDEILADVNGIINAGWTASGFTVAPNKLLLPPAAFALISSKRLNDVGNISVKQYLENSSLALTVNGSKLDIQPLKWLTDRGVSGVDRMVAYTNDMNYLRFPMVPIRRETPYYLGIKYNAPYIWAYGEVEIVYPETVLYRDGIG